MRSACDCNGWKAVNIAATSKGMFRYNASTFTVEDEERDLVVVHRGGHHSSFHGSIKSQKGSFDFMIERRSNQYFGLSIEQLKDPTESARLRNLDYQVQLHITTDSPTSGWDRQETPADLALEAALALETGFYKTERSRIKIN